MDVHTYMYGQSPDNQKFWDRWVIKWCTRYCVFLTQEVHYDWWLSIVGNHSFLESNYTFLRTGCAVIASLFRLHLCKCFIRLQLNDQITSSNIVFDKQCLFWNPMFHEWFWIFRQDLIEGKKRIQKETTLNCYWSWLFQIWWHLHRGLVAL